MSQGAAGFDRTVEDYYKAWFRYHPEAAVEAGVPGYARLLTPYGDEERGALVNLNDVLIDALDELDGQALSADLHFQCPDLEIVGMGKGLLQDFAKVQLL